MLRKTGRLLNRLIAGTLLTLPVLVGCTANPSPEPYDTIKDCPHCPTMVRVPAGTFLMGSAEEDRLTDPRTGKPATNDGPQHTVTFVGAIEIGQFEVTVSEYSQFVAAANYQAQGPCMEFSPPDSFSISDDATWNNTGFSQTEHSPVVCVSYFDAVAYANWLSEQTGVYYRLPTEAEWEYAARGGSQTPYFWGTVAEDSCQYANIRSDGADSISKRQTLSDQQDGFPCDDGRPHTSAAGTYLPNAYNLHDTQGNVWEWVQDCNHKDYDGAPDDGSAWIDQEGCQFGIIRGGSFINRVERSSTTVRAGRPREGRATNMGFRLVRDSLHSPEPAEAEPQDWNPSTTGQPAGQADTAAEIFAANCQACHQRSDDFRGVYGRTAVDVEETIRSGGNNIMSMPAFGEQLSQDEIAGLAEFIREQNDWQE